MALTSPGVEVTIIDESQYLPAPIGTVPLVVVATAENKANPAGTGVAQATTAANAGKLYQVTSQRDLVTLYGNPFFYTTTNGTPIQGYELNEYGLLAAYSLLGVSNRCYVLRADIDLASLVGKTGRPVGKPDNGTAWLDTTSTTWGIFEWNATTGLFTEKTPIVISDSAYLSGGVPVASLGSIGDYAVDAMEITAAPSSSSAKTYYYKNQNNTWVSLGSTAWLQSTATILGTNSNPTLVAGTLTLKFNNDSTQAATLTISLGDTVYDVASAINALSWENLTATVVSGKLAIYSSLQNGSLNNYVTVSASAAGVLTALGIPSGNYYQPLAYYGTAAQMPLWSSSQQYPRPSGSVWMKMGEAGNGFAPAYSVYNSTLASWETKTVTQAFSDASAIYALDPTGGQAIPAGTVYAQLGSGGTLTNGFAKFASAPTYFWKRAATGPTIVTGDNTSPVFADAPSVADYVLRVSVSTPNASTTTSFYSVILSDNDTATDFATAWSAANIPWTTCTVSDSGAIVLTHTLGGTIILNDQITDSADPDYPFSNGIIAEIGLTPGTTSFVKEGTCTALAVTQAATTAVTGSGSGLELNATVQYGFYAITGIVNGGSGYNLGDQISVDGTLFGGATPANDLIAVVSAVSGSGVTGLVLNYGTGPIYYNTLLSNWVDPDYTANEGAPNQAPANDTNWFYSVTDEVDIMVNTSSGWRGYRNVNYDSNGFPSSSGSNTTDPNGPIVSATEPTTQSDGTALVYGDIWIDTSDLEMYPVISRWQSTVLYPSGQWVLIDNTDQTSSSGVLFADARWAPNGTTNPYDDPIPTIKTLLSSNYLDVDAPETANYPVGMLLFNTRRSGYNVKQFKVNYFNSVNFPDVALPDVTDAWVSASGLQSNGAPYMGRQAQRAMVVASLRSVIDTNTDIRDEDNFFNLIATPNYPELQPNMVVLNADRGETGYIIGDTPMGLSDSATEIQAWATNAAGATSTGEAGCVTRNTYLGLFYPSGIAADLNGNLVAVPPSHMMLRTFIRNDQIAYPWFAAAGTRRGTIDNAANIGYVNRTTGEFQVVKTRVGIRDVLYTNFINPLVFFTGNGLLNYGNKTSYNSQSALDRTNVDRLVAYIRRQLTIAGRPFVFEPNDALTRKNISAVVESLMSDLQAKRGIYDYLVVCDESNNTPARIDRNELWIDVAIEPVKAVEFIYIPVRILNTGELAAL